MEKVCNKCRYSVILLSNNRPPKQGCPYNQGCGSCCHWKKRRGCRRRLNWNNTYFFAGDLVLIKTKDAREYSCIITNWTSDCFYIILLNDRLVDTVSILKYEIIDQITRII